MAAYTFAPAVVLVEATGDLDAGATGVLRTAAGGDIVPIYDLNDSPIAVVTVGVKGAHQSFKADVPSGILDFGSDVLIPTICQEALTAALDVKDATGTLTDRVLSLEQGAVSGFGRVLPLPRIPTAQDANEGDLVLVNSSFSG